MKNEIYCRITQKVCISQDCPRGGYIGTGYGCLNTAVKPASQENKLQQNKHNTKRK